MATGQDNVELVQKNVKNRRPRNVHVDSYRQRPWITMYSHVHWLNWLTMVSCNYILLTTRPVRGVNTRQRNHLWNKMISCMITAFQVLQSLLFPFRACERSGSGRISAHRSNLFLWLPIPVPFPAPRPPAPAPANFFHTRSPLRSRSPDFWPAPLQFRSAPIYFKQQTEKVEGFLSREQLC